MSVHVYSKSHTKVNCQHISDLDVETIPMKILDDTGTF